MDIASMTNLELAKKIARDMPDGSFESEAYSEWVVENFVKPLEKKADDLDKYAAAGYKTRFVYQLIQYASLLSLETRVNEDIKNGWKPLGGVQTVVLPPGGPMSPLSYIVYTQAMVRD
jgi:hypothetical protein